MTEKQRSSIYSGLSKVLGEEEAEALLAQIPSNELDDPATKEFVRAEMNEMRAEMMLRMRNQTMWLSGLVLAAIGVVRSFG